MSSCDRETKVQDTYRMDTDTVKAIASCCHQDLRPDASCSAEPMTFSAAKTFCEAGSMRLCAANEVWRTCGSSCNHTDEYVWTSEREPGPFLSLYNPLFNLASYFLFVTSV